MGLIPEPFLTWFTKKNWQVYPHQHTLLANYQAKLSTLLIAPTGAGKTLSALLPTLIDLTQNPKKNQLHTLYISPLKALTYDIERNLEQPIQAMQLPIEIAIRTGDTSSHLRSKQRKKPPNILLTTPESLMLLLSYPDAKTFFQHLRWVIIDECHSFAYSKRGDFTSLALSNLARIAPQHRRCGLSATVAAPDHLAQWVGTPGNPVTICHVHDSAPPDIQILATAKPTPYGGYSADHATAEILDTIDQHTLTLIFVNTRAQAEKLFQSLWHDNHKHHPIAIYHGSLDSTTRRNTEKMTEDGKIRALVTTSALEMGIDWSNIDCIIQVGAPKGICRLLQRIGRANHQYQTPSTAFLLPCNRFETLECQAAITLVANKTLDHPPLAEKTGSLDVLAQYILNCCCQGPTSLLDILADCHNTTAYQTIHAETLTQLFAFHEQGGYALQQYAKPYKIEKTDAQHYQISARAIANKHRRNSGTILESARLKVKKRQGKKRHYTTIGSIEEAFVQKLQTGDTFVFAGEIVAYEKIHDMEVLVRSSQAKKAKIPSYTGGQLPLSTHLEKTIREILGRHDWQQLPTDIQEWLRWQEQCSVIPQEHQHLIETFTHQDIFYTCFYTFAGRPVNNTLGMLISLAWEDQHYQPLAFNCSDYGLAIQTLKKVPDVTQVLQKKALLLRLDAWISQSQLAKRSFRSVATIAGLIERQLPGKRKTLKQVTFSSDLIYDVLLKYEPEHILLQATKQDTLDSLISLPRLEKHLDAIKDHLVLRDTGAPSPLSIPLLTTANQENIQGEALIALLDSLT